MNRNRGPRRSPRHEAHPVPPKSGFKRRLIIDRLLLIFQHDRTLRRQIYNILGFYPHNIEYYRTAFAHSSSDARNRKGKPLNNERLEFLGDAVLETVVSDIVFRHFNRRREGFLTGTRSKIVQRSTLNQLADKMGISRLVKRAPQSQNSRTNIGGNAFEALMGAVYLDRGYDFCHRFIALRVLGKYINLEAVARKEENFKSKVLEWSQKNKLSVEFRMAENGEKGKDETNFVSKVILEGIEAGEGTGRSKKESHQRAAKAALDRLRRDQAFKESIFRAKEQRTSMEAEEYATLPGDGVDVLS